MTTHMSFNHIFTILLVACCITGQAEWNTAPFMLDPTVNPCLNPADQYDLAQASNDSNLCLVVWTDNYNSCIYGMRIDGSGKLLDTVGISIATSPLNERYTYRRIPQVTWCHDAFFVVWQEQVISSYNLYGRRVASDGSMPDVKPFLIETNSGSVRYPTIAAIGTNALAAWATYSGGYVIQAQRLALDGQRLGDTFNVITGLTTYIQPTLNGGTFEVESDSFLCVYPVNSDIWGQRIATDGTLIDSSAFPICTNSGSQYAPALSVGAGPLGDEGWWAVWTDTRTGADGQDLYGGYISANGMVSDTATGRCVISRSSDQFKPSLAPHDPAPVLSWRSYESPYGICITTLDTNGTPFNDTGDVQITNQTYSSNISRLSSEHHFIAHQDDWCIGNWIDSSSSPITQTTQAYVSLQGVDQDFCDCASDGQQYWASWTAYPDTLQHEGDVFAARVSQSGEVLDHPPLTIYTNTGDQNSTRIAVNTNRALIVWINHSGDYEVWGQLLDTTSGALVGSSLRIGYGNSYDYDANVATDGTNFMVAWNHTDTYEVRGSIISADGTIGSAFTVGGWDVGEPYLDYGSGYYLVAWHDEESYENEYMRVRRYYSDGTSPDAGPINICGPYGGGYVAAVSYNPTVDQFLLAWNSRDDYEIWCTRIDPTTGQSVGTTSVISSVDYMPDFLDACYDGTNWLTVWRERRGYIYQILMSRVNNSGTALDPNGVCVMQEGIYNGICAADQQSGKAFLTLSHNVCNYRGTRYSNRRVLGMCWQSGTNDPNAHFDLTSLCNEPEIYTISATPGSGQATNLILQYTTNLVDGSWTRITDIGILDSGVELDVRFEPPVDTIDNGSYRIQAEW